MINELGLDDKRTELKRLREEHDLDYAIEELDRLLLGIDDGASRIRDIVAGLRTFTHHDESEYKPADIHEGFNAALTLLGGKIRSEIRVIKEFGAVGSFAHYPSLLNQAFMHLILNAAEAIEGAGEIRIKTSTSDGVIAIEVTDTGRGMTDTVRRKAFDPFYTTKDVGGGTGLGLAITKNIIDKHNGQIEINSSKGKGTTIRLLLPVVRDQVL
jgi:signal transduction histidine kinase